MHTEIILYGVGILFFFLLLWCLFARITRPDDEPDEHEEGGF